MNVKLTRLLTPCILILTFVFAASAFAGSGKKDLMKNYKLTKCGTVVHIKSRLEWAPDPGYSMTYDKALKYVQKLNACDHKDWRLPSIKQVRKLYDGSVQAKCIGKSCHKGELFHVHPNLKLGQCCPWTRSKQGNDRIQSLNFTTGNEGATNRKSLGRVLAVRQYEKK